MIEPRLFLGFLLLLLVPLSFVVTESVSGGAGPFALEGVSDMADKLDKSTDVRLALLVLCVRPAARIFLPAGALRFDDTDGVLCINAAVCSALKLCADAIAIADANSLASTSFCPPAALS